MYYTRIDLHRKTSFLTTVDSIGQIVKKANIANEEPRILEYFLALDDDTQVVIESTANWYWLYDLLTEHGMQVVISNPVKTKAIASARIKNDKLDSHMLAAATANRFIGHRTCQQPANPAAQRVAASS
jgi:transposase